LNCIEFKAASLFALKFLGDPGSSGVFMREYDISRRRLLQANQSVPTGGYTLFRSQRL
jgi:hypothetical protein